jgi:hypothetical protein
MASLVGGVVGAVIGGFLTAWSPQGIALGWAIGSGIGSYLGAPNTQGPRLQDRNAQISSYGVTVPIYYAKDRVTCNVIWPQDFTVDEHSHSQGGKGGPEQTTYTYSATFAVLVGGPSEGISRIWMNKKLVYNSAGSPVSDPCIAGLYFHLGTEGQLPNPIMVARDGDAPAYRGYTYIVFDSLELTNSGFGNRPPIVEVEVFTASTVTPHGAPVYLGTTETSPSYHQSAIANIDPSTKWIWSVRPGTFLGAVYVTVVSDIGAQHIVSLSEANVDVHTIWDVCYVGNGEIWVLCGQEFQNHYAIIARFSSGSSNADGSVSTLPTFLGWQTIADGPFDPAAMTWDSTSGYVWIGYTWNNLAVCNVATIDPIFRTTLHVVNLGISIGAIYDLCIQSPYIAVAGTSGPGGNPNFVIIDTTSYAVLSSNHIAVGTYGKGVTFDPIRQRFVITAQASGTYTMVDASSGSVTTQTLYTASGADTSPPVWSGSPLPVSVIYLPVTDRYIFGVDSTPFNGTTLFIVNPISFVVEYTYTYEIGSNNLLISPLLVPPTSGHYVISFDLSHAKRLYLGTPTGGPVSLASVVTDLCTRENGLQVGDIDTTQLTDSVDGFLLTQQMTRRSAIEALQAAYFFDIVEVDHTLKFVKRGRPSSLIIPKDDRAAVLYGSELTPDLNITRASELELPWTIDVSYFDINRDYEIGNQYERRITRNSNNPVSLSLPIVMSASKAKQVAQANLYSAWQRDTFSFETSLKYAANVPTDVVTLTTNSASYIVRLTTRTDVGNGILKWEAIQEDITVYAQTTATPPNNFVPQTIRNPGTTILELIDSPLLRDQDNNPGFYVAVAGTTVGWKGSQIYESVDSGLNYSPILTFTDESIIAIAQGVLGDFTVGNIFDNGNSVTVQMKSGILLSATQEQVLNGVNMAVFGAPGRWEVICFMNATLVSANTYKLTGLLRGRRGTEWCTGTHAVGDILVVASQLSWQRLNINSGELGLPRLYKAPAFDTNLSDANAVNFTNTGIGLKPYSPVSMIGTRDGSNNLTITCNRRSRLGYGTLNAMVPVGESVESYSMDIMSGSTVLRTINAATTSFAYSAANQTSDGITPGNPVTVNIYQISATIGRGYPLHGTV